MERTSAARPPLGISILVVAAFVLLAIIAARWIPGVFVALAAIPALAIMAWIARYLWRQGRSQL